MTGDARKYKIGRDRARTCDPQVVILVLVPTELHALPSPYLSIGKVAANSAKRLSSGQCEGGRQSKIALKRVRQSKTACLSECLAYLSQSSESLEPEWLGGCAA